MFIKNQKPNSTDYTNALTNSHNENAKAMDVVDVSSLVPIRFGKVEFDYVQSGYGTGKVRNARYLSNGVYQETSVDLTEDVVGTAHKTSIKFSGRSASSLGGKGFIIYDNFGKVLVWFNVDFDNSIPTGVNYDRSIEVNLFASNNSETIAQRVSQTLNLDEEFIAISTLDYVVISSSTIGEKQSSEDYNTGLIIKNTTGRDSNSLNNRYWLLNSAENENRYYIWYNIANSGVNPNIAGRTGIMVSLNLGASASQVAQATKLAISMTGKFLTNIVNENKLIIVNDLIGSTDEASEGTCPFTIFTTKYGEDREVLATLVFGYDINGKINSIERL